MNDRTSALPERTITRTTGESRRLGEGWTRITKRWFYWALALLILVFGTLFALLQPPHSEPMRGLSEIERWQHPEMLNGWLAQPDFAGLNINDVHMVSKDHIVVVGDGGLIAYTQDGGRCWDLGGIASQHSISSSSLVFETPHWWNLTSKCTSSGRLRSLLDRIQLDPATIDVTHFQARSFDLTAVHFVDAQSGWAVGQEGTVLATADGGRTWQTQMSGTDARLTSVHFVNTQNGWAVGQDGTVLATVNGGRTWQAQDSNTDAWLLAAHFVDTQNGRAIGFGGTVIATANGGRTWQVQDSRADAWPTAVHFVDTQNGWAVGYGGTILITADGGRTWQTQISREGPGLSAIHFVDAQNGWVVGFGGTVLATNNGGQTWQTQSSGTLAGLTAVHFVDTQNGWGVGRSGTILSTADGGRTWQMQTSGMDARLTALTAAHFVDAQNGWAVGRSGTVLATANGGRTWQAQTSGTSSGLTAVHFIDIQNGRAVGQGGTVLTTVDGGRTWQTQPSGTETALSAIHFVDAQNGWVVGRSGTILTSVDGGRTWRAQISGTEAWLLAVHFADAQNGWAVGQDGTVLATIDGGRAWQTQTGGQSEDLFAVHFADAQNGWAVGRGGTILATTDSGRTWQAQTSGTRAWLLAVHFVDAQNGKVVGQDGTVLATANGGRTWQTQISGTDEDLFAVHFVDAQNGWAVARSGMVLSTTHGDRTWQTQTSGTDANLSAVQFVDAQSGWAIGQDGTVLATVDGGRTWQSQTSGTNEDLFAVHFVDAHNGWAVGRSGTVLATINGGRTWHGQISGTEALLLAVYFADAKNGWAVGQDGTVLDTADGGHTWKAQNNGARAQLTAAHPVDSQNSWGVGLGGTVLHTADSDHTWQAQSSGASNDLFAVHFVDTQNGTAVGQDGAVLTTTDGGLSWQTQISGTSNDLFAVDFVDTQNGWAVGDSGTILALSPWHTVPNTLMFRPAIWFWLLFLLIPVLWIAGAFARTHSHRLSALIGGRLLSDRPLQHPEQLDPRSPLLAQAQELSAFLRNGDTLAPVSIAVEGDWGSGKSSLMQLVHGDLQRKGFAPIWFNAWHHERGEHLLASLYHAMRRCWYAPGPWAKLGAFGNFPAFALSTLRLLWLRSRRTPLLATAWVFGSALVFSHAWPEIQVLGDFLFGNGSQRPSSSVSLWLWPSLAFLALFSPLFGIVLWQWWMRRKFRTELSHLLSADGEHKAESKAAARIRFAQSLQDWSYARGDWRLVLFIDDLDRCTPQTVLEVLELSNFLATTGQVICVVAMQKRWVLDCVRLHYKGVFEGGHAGVQADADAARYLEKMFTLRWRIPELSRVDVESLLQIDAWQSDTIRQTATAQGMPSGSDSQTDTAPARGRRRREKLGRRLGTLNTAFASRARNVRQRLEWPLARVTAGWGKVSERSAKLWRPLAITGWMLKQASPHAAIAILALLLGSAWYGAHLAQRLPELSNGVFDQARSEMHRLVAQQESPTNIAGSREQPASVVNDSTEQRENPQNENHAGPRSSATGHTFALRLRHVEPSLQWDARSVRMQAWLAGMSLLVLLGSMGWQGWHSLRGNKQEDVFEGDSPEFIEALRPYLNELSRTLQTPRDWKRLLNQLRQAAISITPLLCEASKSEDKGAAMYLEATLELAQFQRESGRHGPGLRRAWLKAREERARAKLPLRRYSERLERTAMEDVVAVVLAQRGVTMTREIEEDRKQLIRLNLPSNVQP